MRAAWWWIDRWRQSSAYRDFTPEQKGMYRDLLDEVWLRDGHVIPDDDRVLGLIVGDPERWKILRTSILSRFKRVGGGWTHETALEVIGQSKRRAENQKRYRERLDNRDDNGTDNAADNKADSPSQSLNVLPSPAAPETSSPIVSVVASVVQAPANPLAKPVKPGKETWLTPFGADWTEAYGGDPSWGELAKVLKKPVDDLGAPEVRTRWRLYLGQTEGRFASPTRFAQTVVVWTEETVARMQPRDMRSMTVGDFNAATYERVMKRLQERDHAGQGAIAQGSAQTRSLLPGTPE